MHRPLNVNTESKQRNFIKQKVLPSVHKDPSQCTLCCQWPSERKDLPDAETRAEEGNNY